MCLVRLSDVERIRLKDTVTIYGGWVVLIIIAVTLSSVVIGISISASKKVPFSTTSFCMRKTDSVHEYKECLEVLK